MPSRKEDITQQVARIIFMMLFFVVLFSGTAKLEKSTCNVQYGLATELHSGSVKAIIADPLQLPAFQKSLPTSTDIKGLLLYNYKFKIAADNSYISLQIDLLEKTLPLLKPLSTCRFYYHLFHIDASDATALS
jgi:hypothetical protein